MNCMIKIYADLIRKEKKTLEEVPEKLRNEVQQLLNHEGQESD